MNVRTLTETEIEKMRVAGRLAASVLEMIEAHVKVGTTTEELDAICHRYIVDDLQAIPAPLNYRGRGGTVPFPKSICTSVNHVVCHGIPTERKVLKRGDIVNIDVTVIKNGFHGDTSKMFCVGDTSSFAKRLVNITQECLYQGIDAVRPGATLGDIGFVIQQHAEKNRYSVVREFCGHGINDKFHDHPEVLHYGQKGKGLTLKEGMTFTIEPMINAGKRHVRLLPDSWTVVTRDHKLSAQWEHTILVTESGNEILTLRHEESREQRHVTANH